MARIDHTPLQVFTVSPGVPATPRPRNVPARTQRLHSLDERAAQAALDAAPPRVHVPVLFDASPSVAPWSELERAYDRPLARFWRRLLRTLGFRR